MKRILFLVALVAACITGKAQVTPLTIFKFKVDTSIINKTASQSVTRQAVGGRIKELADILKDSCIVKLDRKDTVGLLATRSALSAGLDLKLNKADTVTKIATPAYVAGQIAAYVPMPLWSNVQSKPSSFPPSAHTHNIPDVTGLADSLNAIRLAAGNGATTDTISLSSRIDQKAFSHLVPLIIFNGESNSGGQAQNADLPSPLLLSRPRLQILNNTTHVFEPLHIGVNNYLGHCGPYGCSPSTSHGWENGLAKSFEAGLWYNSSGYLVKTGQGGCTIAQLESIQYFDSFAQRVNIAKSLIRASGKIPYTYIFYTQGINDNIAGTNINTWKTATIAHLRRLRSYVGFAPIIVPYFMTGFSTWDAAMTEVADSIPLMYFVSSTGLPLQDSYHWNAESMDSLGQRMARVCIDQIGQEDAYLLTQNYVNSLHTGGTASSGGGSGSWSTLLDVDFNCNSAVTCGPFSLAAQGSNIAFAGSDSLYIQSFNLNYYAVAFNNNAFTVGDSLRVTVRGVKKTAGNFYVTAGDGNTAPEFNQPLNNGDNVFYFNSAGWDPTHDWLYVGNYTEVMQGACTGIKLEKWNP